MQMTHHIGHLSTFFSDNNTKLYHTAIAFTNCTYKYMYINHLIFNICVGQSFHFLLKAKQLSVEIIVLSIIFDLNLYTKLVNAVVLNCTIFSGHLGSDSFVLDFPPPILICFVFGVRNKSTAGSAPNPHKKLHKTKSPTVVRTDGV